MWLQVSTSCTVVSHIAHTGRQLCVGWRRGERMYPRDFNVDALVDVSGRHLECQVVVDPDSKMEQEAWLEDSATLVVGLSPRLAHNFGGRSDAVDLSSHQ